ncbi:MAG: hypothetical protein ACXWLH_01185 [Candidatus Saccharimonadales bacterium]
MIKEGNKKVKVINKGGGPMGFVLFLAWIGALVYFVQNSEGFGGFLLAILKSIVWPAYVLHAVLGILHI